MVSLPPPFFLLRTRSLLPVGQRDTLLFLSGRAWRCYCSSNRTDAYAISPQAHTSRVYTYKGVLKLDAERYPSRNGRIQKQVCCRMVGDKTTDVMHNLFEHELYVHALRFEQFL
jgi:hypothetical protein